MDNTIIYYTSNREDEAFEKKIQARLLKSKGNIPIISVSQKPIDFGWNICVGDIGVSDENVYKQMLIGCMEATTPFVTFAEADTLYPPEYFQYKPKDINKRYWFENVWVMYPYSEDLQNSFYFKGRSDCGHMAGREYVIKLLKEAGSSGMKYKGKYRPIKAEIDIPIINIKTGNGMRPKTQTAKVPVLSLPYWGKAIDLRKELCA